MNESRTWVKFLAKHHGGSGSFLAQHGREFSPTPVTDAMREWKGKKGLCFMNALKAAIALAPDFYYCEGFAMARGLFPVEHAWICDRAGRAYELTWEEPGLDYFGVAFRLAYATKVALRSGYYGILGNMADEFRLQRGKDKIKQALQEIPR